MFENEIIIKKSKFISKLYYVNSTEEINDILENLKKEYKKATHICYAYSVNGKEKAYDDKEPSHTAGLPILNMIHMKNLNNVLIVVIRYFGGVKLGAGPLTRAYLTSASEVIKQSKKICVMQIFF